jgi:hypothetical protein
MRVTCLTISPSLSLLSQQYLVESTNDGAPHTQASPVLSSFLVHVSTHLLQHLVLRTSSINILPLTRKTKIATRAKQHVIRELCIVFTVQIADLTLAFQIF